MHNREPLPRIDADKKIRKRLLSCCRLKYGDIWVDDISGHKVGCLDATDEADIIRLMGKDKASLSIQDPPYNIVVGNNNTNNLGKISLKDYIEFSRGWVRNTIKILKDDAHFYIWLGADQNEDFQPLPDFMIMMREFKELKTRSFITMRKQQRNGSSKSEIWLN